jgi:hypothetical protein
MSPDRGQAISQSIQQAIGVRLVKVFKDLVSTHPANLRHLSTLLRLTFSVVTAAKDERNDALRHVLVDACQPRTRDDDPYFFEDFALKAVEDRFTWLKRSAWRFPLVVVSATDGQDAFPGDDCRRNTHPVLSIGIQRPSMLAASCIDEYTSATLEFIWL